jgi:hypothetical protein
MIKESLKAVSDQLSAFKALTYIEKTREYTLVFFLN